MKSPKTSVSRKTPKSTRVVPKGKLRTICDDLKDHRSGLGRAEQTAAAKVLFDEAFRAAQGNQPKPKSATIAKFVSFMREHTGLETRMLRYDLQIVQDIDEEVRKAIRGTHIANRTTDLIALSKMNKADQIKGVELLRDSKSEEFAALLPTTTSKSVVEALPPVALNLEVGESVVTRIGASTLSVTLVEISGMTARVIISKVSPTPALQELASGDAQPLSGTTEGQVQPLPLLDAPETTSVPSSQDEHATTNWEMISGTATRPLTAEESDYLGVKNIDGGTPVAMLVLPDHLDATTLVLGMLAEFAKDAAHKPAADIAEKAQELGLVSMKEAEPEPNATLVVLFSKANARCRLVGVGRCDDAGEFPAEVIVARPGQNMACKVAVDGSILGSPQQMWIMRDEQSQADGAL